jgi:predicted nucleic-acid-binding protein
MPGVDTNVIVRYLTQDDRVQARKANAIVEGALAAGEQVHLDEIVICELVWVLSSAYGFDRATISDTLLKLIDSAQISVNDRDAVREAVTRYAESSGDFADYLIGLRNLRSGCESTLTFDRALRHSEFFTLL